jgi:hypothetical protein
MLRTPGTERASIDLICRSHAPLLTPADSALRTDTNLTLRATGRPVERFYTTVDSHRERSTEEWTASTLTTKETR